MNAQAPTRGSGLLAGGRRIGIGPEWLARLWTGGLDRILDRIDRGLARGAIEATLPDGRTRLIGGRAPGFVAQVRLDSWRALLRLATAGSVGWYQAWEAREWDSPDPVPLFALFMDNAIELGDAARAHGPWRLAARALHWLHRNTRSGANRNIHAHYDLGNDFYAAWLGETMIYSSALFDGSEVETKLIKGMQFDRLDRGQSNKCAKLAERLALEWDHDILEIGCGWGVLAAYLADSFGSRVTAISLSDEQLAFARRKFASSENGHLDFRHQDYRDVDEQFDAIVSVEMVEAVGRAYWPAYFDCIARCLRPRGRAAIQYIAMRDELFEHYAASADFIQTYIFPGGMLIRESEFRRLAAERGLEWQDQVDFAKDYAETLRLWRANFDRAVETGRLPADFDERFVRLWRYYLMYCEGGFRGGGITVSQVTLVKSA